MKATLTSEERLCLLLSRGELETGDLELASSIIRTPLDWEAFLRLVQAQEVSPIVFQHLRCPPGELVPQWVSKELDTCWRVNSMHGTLLAGELARMLRALHEAGIQAIPLKGPALAERLYGDVSRRFCGDLDVLVHEQDNLRALAVLAEMGYESNCPLWFASEFRNPNIFEFSLLRPDRAMEYRVDLHWGLFWEVDQERKFNRSFWQQAKPEAYHGVPAYSLSREDEFLFLCVHAARHDWRGLKWLSDIHQAARQAMREKDFRWDYLAKRSSEMGFQNIVTNGLGVCRSLFGLEWPPQWPIPAATSEPRPFGQASPVPSLWRSAISSLGMNERFRDRVRLLAWRIAGPTPVDAEAVALPRRLAFLYYVVRPLRLSWRGLAELFGGRSSHQ